MGDIRPQSSSKFLSMINDYRQCRAEQLDQINGIIIEILHPPYILVIIYTSHTTSLNGPYVLRSAVGFIHGGWQNISFNGIIQAFPIIASHLGRKWGVLLLLHKETTCEQTSPK